MMIVLEWLVLKNLCSIHRNTVSLSAHNCLGLGYVLEVKNTYMLELHSQELAKTIKFCLRFNLTVILYVAFNSYLLHCFCEVQVTENHCTFLCFS